MKPMITNGGPHPADKWADMTADSILELLVDGNPDNVSPEAAAARQAKRDLRPVLFNIFNGHHDRVQKHERGSLKSIKGHAAACDHCDHAKNPLDVTPHLSVMDQVFVALAATPFASHFAQPEVQETLRQIVGRDTANVMHIERRYHSDRMAKGA
jgi:hypothetical protein